MLTRRLFATSLAAAPFALPALAQPAPRAAPRVELPVGRYRVTVLTDGSAQMPFGFFTGIAPEEVALRAAGRHRGQDGALRLSFTQYLIEDGERTVLVDTGPAGSFGDTGKLQPALAGLGVAPEDIDAVILTHTHFDHISGMVADGAAVFPNAEVYVDRRDIAYFTDAARRAQAPDYLHSSFDATAALVAAYPGLQAIEGAHAILPGLETVDLTGHTPGQIGVRIEERLTLVSDMLFHPVVHPATTAGFVFEQDPEAAEAMRTRFFGEAEEQGSLIAATHLPFPGLGRIGRVDGQRVWVPADLAHGA